MPLISTKKRAVFGDYCILVNFSSYFPQDIAICRAGIFCTIRAGEIHAQNKTNSFWFLHAYGSPSWLFFLLLM